MAKTGNVPTLRAGLLITWIGLALLVAGCSLREGAPANQQQPSKSPSGKYVLTVPIKAHSTQPGDRMWRVTIQDAQGKLLYQDTTSDFVGNLNVYWAWDGDDRVWLYSSDTGDVFFWEPAGGAWVKAHWGYGRTRQIERDLAPPAGLYPHYVK